MRQENLIFIYPKSFTFIKTEVRLLSEEYDLIIHDIEWSNKLLLPINLIRQFFFLVINLFRVKKILISFGGYWSLLPAFFGKLFGKKVAIVVHGTDCVSFPEIDYGSLRAPIMRWFIKKSYQFSNIILPVSESLVYTQNSYYSDDVLDFGYTYHLSGIKTPYSVIPNGLVLSDWSVEYRDKLSNTFITVMTENQFLRKGGSLIIDVAKSFPDCNFYFAGINVIEDAPKNIICLGNLSPDSLKDWYKRTQFYLQLSNFEGFGVAICEAMLCGCIPIVSEVNFLPSIVGDSGFILHKRNSDLLVELLKEALNSDLRSLENKARLRIENNFTSEKRKEMLVLALNNC